MVIEGQSISFKWSSGSVVVMIVWHLDLQLSVQSVHFITKVVSSSPAHGEGYSIQHYVIKFVSDFRQVGGFLRVLRFSPHNKKTKLHNYF